MPQAARGKIGGVRLFDGLPGIEHHHAVCDGQGQLKVVRNQEHPRARVRDLPEVAQDAARGTGVQARRGFVRDDQPGRLSITAVEISTRRAIPPESSNG